MKKESSRNRISLLALYIFIFLTLIIVFTGTGIYRYQKMRIYQNTWDELGTLAHIKTAQILEWRKSYLSQAEQFLNDKKFASIVEDFIKSRTLSQEAREKIRSYYLNRNIITIRLFYPDGSLLMPLTSSAKNLVPKELFIKPVKERKIIYHDLEYNKILSRPTLDTYIPIMQNADKKKPVIAVLLMTIDPARILFPILSDGLTGKHSSEVYLVRNNGKKVEYLNDMHFQQDTTLIYSRSAGEKSLPAAMAVRGIAGKIEGIEYNDSPVLGFIQPIPDSPWFLIAKVDQDEVLKPLQQIQRMIYVVTILLILMSGITILYFFEVNRRKMEAREHRMQREQKIMLQRFDYLSKYANDVIFLLNDKFEIIEVNDRVTDIYGYSKEELLYKNAASLRPADDPITLEQIKQKFGDKDGIVYETYHQRKDGTVFPIEISLRLIKVDETAYFQGSIRDITQRKITEENIKRLNRFYTVLSSINEMVLRVHDRDALFTKACRITVENGQARMAWIGIVDPETKAVNVQACAGITADYLTSITDTAKGSIADKEPVGRAIISGLPVICNDVAHDPMIAPWRDKALECQYHAIAAIPIQLSGNTIGSFAIYSEVVNFFDDNTAKLLSDIAADLSFALDYIDKEEERSKAETSLRESEQKFRNLVEESLVGVYIIQDNRFKYCNPKILEIFGYTKDETLGMPVINTIAESDRSVVMNNLAKRYSGEITSIHYTFQGQRKDDQLIDVEVFGTRTEWEGRPAVIGTLLDITERKQSERALIERDQLLSLTGEVAKVGGWQLDATVLAENAKYIGTWTDAAALIHDIDPAKTNSIIDGIDCYTKESRDQITTALHKSIESAEQLNLEIEMTTVKGNHKWVSIIGKPVIENDKVIKLIGSIQDITERKMAEQAIYESESKFRSLVEGSLVGVYILQDYKFVYTNPRLNEIYGFTEQELLGTPIINLVVEEDRQFVLDNMTKLYTGEIPSMQYSFRVQRKDRSIIDAEVYSAHIEYHGRSAVIGTIIDITEHKAIERALRASEDLYRAVVEHSQNGVLIVGSNYRINYTNQSMLLILQQTEEEVVGQDFREFLDEESRQLVADYYIRRRRGEDVPSRYEFNIIRKNGEKRRVEISSTVVKDIQGEIFTMAQFLDITDRIQAEENLRENEERLRLAIEATQQGLFDVNLITNIILFSPEYAQLLGYEPCEIRQDRTTWLEWIHPDDRDRVDQYFKEFIISPETNFRIEYRAKNLSGEYLWFESFGKKIEFDSAGHPTRLIGTHININERKQAEIALQKSEQKFRQLFDTMVEGLILVELIYNDRGEAVNYRVLDANPASEKLAGIRADDIIGKTMTDLYPNAEPLYLDIFANIASSGQSYSFETHFEKLDAYFRIIAFSPLRGQCAIIFEDITEKKLWENTLRESEERLRLTLNSTGQGLYDINMQTGEITSTPEYARMLGYDPIDFHDSQAKLFKRIHPDDLDKIKKLFTNNNSPSNPEFKIEFRQKTYSGNYIWVLSVGKIIETDEKGQIRRILGTNLDITASKETQEALRRSEEQLRLALKAAEQGMFDINLKTGDMTTTPDFAQLMGYDADTHYENYDTWMERIHPDDRKIIAKIFKQFKNSKQSEFRAEYRQRKADGNFAWILSVGKVIEYDKDGTPLRLLGTNLDITSRKVADAALQESEERFRGLYENATIGIYRTTPDGTILMANPACVRMLGFDSFDEMSRKSIIEWGLISANQHKMFREQIAKQNVITGIEGTWLKKDGTVIHVLESARAVRDDDGKIIYYDGTFEDITERKNAEMALQEIHAQYRQALIQAKAVPFLRYYYQDSYAFIGEEIVKYTGYAADEFRPNLWLTLRQDSTMLGDCSGMDIHSAAEAFRNGKIQHWLADYKIRTRNGEIRWLNDSSVPITDQNGKVIGSLGVLQDITERKHAEEVIKNINRELEQRVIQRTAQLEAANKELEAFSYSVSHDLRAPLRAIDGFAKILLEDYRDKLDDEGQRLFNIIRANAQKMGQLISDLLQFSRAGRKEIFIGPVDLNQIFRELFAELTQNLSDRTIKFNLKRLPKVKGDASLLKVVVTNLLSNAIKYTRQSSVARISVNYQKEADRFIFSIKDNGVGFDMRYADKLFGVFQRLHSEQEFEGTGVGLALVQRIIHKHGGQVWAESELNQGATFYFSLPVRNDSDQEAQT